MIELKGIYKNGFEAVKTIKLCKEVYKIKKSINVPQTKLNNLEIEFQTARKYALKFGENISKYPTHLN